MKYSTPYLIYHRINLFLINQEGVVTNMKEGEGVPVPSNPG